MKTYAAIVTGLLIFVCAWTWIYAQREWDIRQNYYREKCQREWLEIKIREEREMFNRSK